MDELEGLARSGFGLTVAERLPVHESHSSQVLSFLADDGRHYVLKRPWAANKAWREAAALLALDAHPDVPELLGISEHGDVPVLLIEGLDGVPWDDVGASSTAMLRRLGRSMGELHATPAESFDGEASWHALLRANLDRFVDTVGRRDVALVEQARELFVGRLDEVPDTDRAVRVHFDLRPGNVLVREGTFVGLIDFESCRGGHPSLDFFKLAQQVAPYVDGGLSDVLAGYHERTDGAAPWADEAVLAPLLQIYALYHGTAGLAWCHARDDFSGDFPDVNRLLIHAATMALA